MARTTNEKAIDAPEVVPQVRGEVVLPHEPTSHVYLNPPAGQARVQEQHSPEAQVTTTPTAQSIFTLMTSLAPMIQTTFMDVDASNNSG